MDPSKIILGNANWDAWRSHILEKALDFGEAGDSLTTAIEPKFEQPLPDDMRHRRSGAITQMATIDREIARGLADAIAFADGEADDIDEDDLRNRVLKEYIDVYPNLAMFQEAYRTALRRSERYRDDKPRFMSYILSAMSEQSKERLRANPGYGAALAGKDLLAIWKIANNIFGRRGVYSHAVSMTKLVNLKQGPADSFEGFVNAFRDTVRALRDAGAPIQDGNATVMFHNSVNSTPFRQKVLELLGTVPLPALEDVIRSLSDQLILRDTMKETNASMREAPKQGKREAAKQPHDTTVNKAEVKSSKKDPATNALICFNCNRPGHGVTVCPDPRVTCTTCGKLSHLAIHCEKATRVLSRSKASSKKTLYTVEIDKSDDDYLESDFYVLQTIIADQDLDLHYQILPDYFELVDLSLPESLEWEVHDASTKNPHESEPVVKYNSAALQRAMSLKSVYHAPPAYPLVYVTRNTGSQFNDHLAIMDSGSQENVVYDMSLVHSACVLDHPVGIIGIGGHRNIATHRGLLHHVPMDALVAPSARQRIIDVETNRLRV